MPLLCSSVDIGPVYDSIYVNKAIDVYTYYIYILYVMHIFVYLGKCLFIASSLILSN